MQKSAEQITKEIHEIAKDFSDHSFCKPFVSVLQPRRDFREKPAQHLQSAFGRMIDFTSMSVAYHAIDGNPVDVSRCYLMDKALEDDAKYALFIDEDTALPSYGAVNLIETAAKHPDAIIVGVYYVKFGGPMISQLDEARRWTYIDATPHTGLRRNIPSCGLGCALIPLSVIRKMKAQFPDIPLFCIVPEGCWGDPSIKALGEDTWFYHLVEKCGIEVICDTSVQCLHMELKTGKYTAHPDVKIGEYLTNMPITTPLTLADRPRVSAEYLARIQQPEYVNGINQPVKDLPVDYSPDTLERVLACLKDVNTTQNYYEAAMLCQHLDALRPQTILEIGVDKGGTMNLWLNFAAPDALYVGVDKAMQFVCKRDHPGRTKTLIEADSKDALAKVTEALAGRPVDFLFIDGDHSEEGVRSDWAMYSPLVRKGGIAALHDIDVSVCQEECGGIKKLWGELKEKHGDNATAIVNTEAQYHFGIGMIRM